MSIKEGHTKKNSDWYCDYDSAKKAISLFGRATRKAWKKDKPGQYIDWLHHGLAPTDLTLHFTGGGTAEYNPSIEDKKANDWIVYYSE